MVKATRVGATAGQTFAPSFVGYVLVVVSGIHGLLFFGLVKV